MQRAICSLRFATFLCSNDGDGARCFSLAAAISMLGAICGGVIFGLLSDRLGRRRSMIIALGCAILIMPL